ncbi:MAG TPA: hypothetical protein EYP57_02300 [Thermodesulfobacteriaceae bacterium]|nr:hypothetical protein [Thermodesulfobacteriaceae bacterium]
MYMSDRVFFLSADIEITNKCHNRCAICPRDRMTRTSGYMEEPTFSGLLSLFSGRGMLITFSGLGDPLLHPKCLDYVRRLRKTENSVGIVIHPSSLNDEDHLRDLVRSSPSQITVSFPSLKREIFENLCPGSDFKEDLEKTLYLINLTRNKTGIRISGIRTRLNPYEKKDFLEYWKGKGVDVWFKPCHGRGGHLRDSRIYQRKGEGLCSGSCSLMRFHTFITWQGDVLACCHDLTGETKMGNIADMQATAILEAKNRAVDRRPPFVLCNLCDEPLRNVKLPPRPAAADKKSRRIFFRNIAGQVTTDPVTIN